MEEDLLARLRNEAAHQVFFAHSLSTTEGWGYVAQKGIRDFSEYDVFENGERAYGAYPFLQIPFRMSDAKTGTQFVSRNFCFHKKAKTANILFRTEKVEPIHSIFLNVKQHTSGDGGKKSMRNNEVVYCLRAAKGDAEELWEQVLTNPNLMERSFESNFPNAYAAILGEIDLGEPRIVDSIKEARSAGAELNFSYRKFKNGKAILKRGRLQWSD